MRASLRWGCVHDARSALERRTLRCRWACDASCVLFCVESIAVQGVTSLLYACMLCCCCVARDGLQAAASRRHCEAVGIRGSRPPPAGGSLKVRYSLVFPSSSLTSSRFYFMSLWRTGIESCCGLHFTAAVRFAVGPGIHARLGRGGRGCGFECPRCL